MVTEATGSVRCGWCSPSGQGPARPRGYATEIVDFTPGRPPQLLDLVNGRSGAVLADWLARSEDWRARSSPLRWTVSGLLDRVG